MPNKSTTDRGVKRTASVEKSNNTDGPAQFNITINEERERGLTVGSKKHYGKWEDPNSKAKTILFMSTKKEAQLFLNENEYIIFKKNTFETNVPEAIEFLRGCSEFEISIFEDKFPQRVLDMFKQDNKWITRDPDEYQ